MARHIDADKINFKGVEPIFYNHSYYIPLRFAEAVISTAPTADVVEVKHGEWKNFEIPHMMRCSECGVSDLDIHRKKFAFCPYCGAKMNLSELPTD